MIVGKVRALSEEIRDRCKRTKAGAVLSTAIAITLAAKALLLCSDMFFCYEPFCPSLHDFRQRLFMEPSIEKAPRPIISISINK